MRPATAPNSSAHAATWIAVGRPDMAPPAATPGEGYSSNYGCRRGACRGRRQRPAAGSAGTAVGRGAAAVVVRGAAGEVVPGAGGQSGDDPGGVSGGRL